MDDIEPASASEPGDRTLADGKDVANTSIPARARPPQPQPQPEQDVEQQAKAPVETSVQDLVSRLVYTLLSEFGVGLMEEMLELRKGEEPFKNPLASLEYACELHGNATPALAAQWTQLTFIKRTYEKLAGVNGPSTSPSILFSPISWAEVQCEQVITLMAWPANGRDDFVDIPITARRNDMIEVQTLPPGSGPPMHVAISRAVLDQIQTLVSRLEFCLQLLTATRSPGDVQLVSGNTDVAMSLSRTPSQNLAAATGISRSAARDVIDMHGGDVHKALESINELSHVGGLVLRSLFPDLPPGSPIETRGLTELFRRFLVSRVSQTGEMLLGLQKEPKKLYLAGQHFGFEIDPRLMVGGLDIETLWPTRMAAIENGRYGFQTLLLSNEPALATEEHLFRMFKAPAPNLEFVKVVIHEINRLKQQLGMMQSMLADIPERRHDAPTEPQKQGQHLPSVDLSSMDVEGIGQLLRTNALSVFVPLIQSEEFDGAILADEENFTKQFIDDEWPDVRLIQRASFWRKLQRFRASSKTMTTSVEPEHAIWPSALPVVLIKAMLRRESELRLSSHTQEMYRAARGDNLALRAIVPEIQRAVAKEFGVLEAVGLAAMRGAESLVPAVDVAEIRDISFYRKYNRMQDGKLSVGDVAPDVELHKLTIGGAVGTKVALSSMQQPGRPLAIIAVSYSWPPLRPMLGDLVQLATKWRAEVHFVLVYIQEAHAVDEWPIAQQDVDIQQHKTLADRAQAASLFKSEEPILASLPLFLDDMHNSFNLAFSSWPLRFWVIDNGVVAFKSMPRGHTIHFSDFAQFIETHQAKDRTTTK